MTTEYEATSIGLALGDAVIAALEDFQRNAPRTKQSSSRVLGMSEMGGCREYIRATIAGDTKNVRDGVKFAAYMGTAIGDFTENILGGYGFNTQEDAVVELPRTKIKVRGHLDARNKSAVIDLKTRDELTEMRREGPSFKERAQISGYLVGKVQEGVLNTESTGHLVYLDRSGKDEVPYVWSVNYETALLILDAVENRLEDVQNALATGQRAPRDEPESWCYAISCPFYDACWAGYTPTAEIAHEREIKAVQEYVAARAAVKDATAMQKAKRAALIGVEGVTPEGTVVRWTLTTTAQGESTRLDVR